MRKDVLADGSDEELVVPRRYSPRHYSPRHYSKDMVRGLVCALDTVWARRVWARRVRARRVWVKPGGHGFHAFAFSRQEKARALAG